MVGIKMPGISASRVITVALFITLAEVTLQYNEGVPVTASCNVTGCEGCSCTMTDDKYITEVTCNDTVRTTLPTPCLQENVTSLAVYGGNLTTIKMGDLANATELTSLVITNTLLDTIEEGSFDNVTGLSDATLTWNAQLKMLPNNLFMNNAGLRYLDLSGNKLEKLGANTLGGLSGLEEVDLSHNNIGEIEEGALQGPSKSLKLMELQNNVLSAVNYSHFVSLEALEFLDLRINKISTIDLGAFTQTDSLETVILSHNQITDLGENTLPTNENLRYLDLNNNNLTKVPSGALKDCKTLNLDLSMNPIQSIESGAFSGMSRLTSLYINESPELTTLKAGAMSGLSSLQNLVIANNPKLVSIDGSALEDCPLEYLDLSHNAIATFNESLFNYTTLEMADISNNPVNCSCDARWIRAQMMGDECPDWMKGWSDELQCHSPDNLAKMYLKNIHTEDFTCEKAVLQQHNILSGEQGALIEAVLTLGLPNTSWKTPDGKTIVPQRTGYFDNLEKYDDDSPIKATEWRLADGSTVVARLMINLTQPHNVTRNSSTVYYGNYTLNATNAGGVMLHNLGLDRPEPEPTGSGGLNTGFWIAIGIGAATLVLVAGIIFVKMRQCRKDTHPYQVID